VNSILRLNNILPPFILWTMFETSLAYACEISLYPVQFGIYTGTAVQARGAVVLDNCPTTPAKINLDAGLHSNGQFAARALSNGTGQYLVYNLYLEAGFNSVWGDGTQGTQILQARTGEFAIYAYVPQQGIPPEGIYTDNVMVMVEW